MKNRSKLLVAILPVLACFALLPGAQAVCLDGCGSNFNTFQGEDALSFNIGAGNTAFGWKALVFNSDGSFNTGLGGGALALNNGLSNTAVGAAAGLLNTAGTQNVAVGTDAMVFNDTGDDNTAVGAFALENNVSGFTNVAVGTFAAQNNTATFNTALGGFALQANTGGSENTAVGAGAMESADGGSDNTAVGFLAGNDITGNSNTCLGHSAGSTLTSGSQNIYIGADVQPGAAGELRFIRIGDTTFTDYDCFIAGIQDRVIDAGANPHFVLVDDNGKLGTIAANEIGIGTKTAQPQAMLNEFLKDHLKVQELQATVAQQQKQIEALTAGLQKVSAQIEVNKPATKVVVNKP